MESDSASTFAYRSDSVLKTGFIPVRYSYNVQETLRERERPNGSKKAPLSHVQNRSGLQTSSHQSTSFDSGFADNGQEESVKLPTVTAAWLGDELPSSRYVSPQDRRVPSPSALSLTYVETVSWDSDTDEMIERAIATFKPYSRRVPPAREIRVLSGSAKSEDNEESTPARSKISYSADDEASDGSTVRVQPKKRPRLIHVREKTTEDNLVSVSNGVEKRHGFSDIFAEKEVRVHSSDDGERELSASTGHLFGDWESLSSFSYYESYKQMGLANYLEAKGDLCGVSKEDLLLDLTWVDRENPTPRRGAPTFTIAQDEQNECIPRPDNPTPSKSEAADKKKKGKLRRFFSAVRKMLCPCSIHKYAEDDSGEW